jgi:hypothetical protein
VTADPIAGINYPTRSQAPNITNTMKPAIDQIGGLIKSGLPRGGQFAPSSFNLTAGVVATLTLARVSGDTDMISSGNVVVPATWGGVWAMTIYFQTTIGTTARTFIDVKNLTTGRIYRLPFAVGEDRFALNVTTQLAAGNAIQVQAYSDNNLSSNTLSLDMWRLS